MPVQIRRLMRRGMSEAVARSMAELIYGARNG